MLRINNLSYKNILLNINLNFYPGDICGVFGHSGSGKSTLLKLIKGLVEENRERETILLNNEKISLYDTSISYMHQESVFFTSKTIMENLLLTGKNIETVERYLEKLNLKEVAKKNILTLSGGEKQMLSICRALLLESKVLLMDEPFAALDGQNSKKISNIIKDIGVQNNLIIIIISHNSYNLDIYNQFLYLKNGRIEYFGKDIDKFKIFVDIC